MDFGIVSTLLTMEGAPFYLERQLLISTHVFKIHFFLKVVVDCDLQKLIFMWGKSYLISRILVPEAILGKLWLTKCNIKFKIKIYVQEIGFNIPLADSRSVRVLIMAKQNTKSPFLLNFCLPSAIKQPKTVSKGVHFGKNGTRTSFLVNFDLLNEISKTNITAFEILFTIQFLILVVKRLTHKYHFCDYIGIYIQAPSLIPEVGRWSVKNGCMMQFLGMCSFLLSICSEHHLWKDALLVFMILLITPCKVLLEVYMLIFSSFLSLLLFSVINKCIFLSLLSIQLFLYFFVSLFPGTIHQNSCRNTSQNLRKMAFLCCFCQSNFFICFLCFRPAKITKNDLLVLFLPTPTLLHCYTDKNNFETKLKYKNLNSGLEVLIIGPFLVVLFHLASHSLLKGSFCEVLAKMKTLTLLESKIWIFEKLIGPFLAVLLHLESQIATTGKSPKAKKMQLLCEQPLYHDCLFFHTKYFVRKIHHTMGKLFQSDSPKKAKNRLLTTSIPCDLTPYGQISEGIEINSEFMSRGWFGIIARQSTFSEQASNTSHTVNKPQTVIFLTVVIHRRGYERRQSHGMQSWEERNIIFFEVDFQGYLNYSACSFLIVDVSLYATNQVKCLLDLNQGGKSRFHIGFFLLRQTGKGELLTIKNWYKLTVLFRACRSVDRISQMARAAEKSYWTIQRRQPFYIVEGLKSAQWKHYNISGELLEWKSSCLPGKRFQMLYQVHLHDIILNLRIILCATIIIVNNNNNIKQQLPMSFN
ncbi:hypothetical protein VP01_1043g1 [Puccinia sorghi]|uniref:Uncharacterized protein n=1 Tax=Puccinia sorghi TaxID=27349 RepID=A0A0L6VUJ8_9BASI|nr:hypothetical protein VP01_1043g1 [Puccinia sorghi]